jgi:hypothetical protein
MVRVQEADFDVGAELAALRRDDPQIGALASFVGLVREMNDGAGVSEMTLEHYPGMTEKALEEIVGEARRRWAVIDALVIHRVGRLLADRSDRPGRGRRRAPWRSLCRLRVHHGLPENPRTVLEARSHPGR